MKVEAFSWLKVKKSLLLLFLFPVHVCFLKEEEEEEGRNKTLSFSPLAFFLLFTLLKWGGEGGAETHRNEPVWKKRVAAVAVAGAVVAVVVEGRRGRELEAISRISIRILGFLLLLPLVQE